MKEEEGFLREGGLTSPPFQILCLPNPFFLSLVIPPPSLCMPPTSPFPFPLLYPQYLRSSSYPLFSPLSLPPSLSCLLKQYFKLSNSISMHLYNQLGGHTLPKARGRGGGY